MNKVKKSLYFWVTVSLLLLNVGLVISILLIRSSTSDYKEDIIGSNSTESVPQEVMGAETIENTNTQNQPDKPQPTPQSTKISSTSNTQPSSNQGLSDEEFQRCIDNETAIFNEKVDEYKAQQEFERAVEIKRHEQSMEDINNTYFSSSYKAQAAIDKENQLHNQNLSIITQKYPISVLNDYYSEYSVNLRQNCY
jgi:hypothetical protein